MRDFEIRYLAWISRLLALLIGCSITAWVSSSAGIHPLPVALVLCVVMYVAPYAGAPHPAHIGAVVAQHLWIPLAWMGVGLMMLPSSSSTAWVAELVASCPGCGPLAVVVLTDALVLSLLSGPLRAAKAPLSFMAFVALELWLIVARLPIALASAVSLESLAVFAASVWGDGPASPVVFPPSWWGSIIKAIVSGSLPSVATHASHCCTTALLLRAVVEITIIAGVARALLTATSYIPSFHVFALRHAVVIAVALSAANALAVSLLANVSSQ